MNAYDVGLLILRLGLGLTLAAHGLNKFFGGGRIPGTARWFESIGMKPGKFHAVVAATTEVCAGLGLAAGLLGLLTALGADAPEISSASSALFAGASEVGVGVILGSNLFNLAALHGLPENPGRSPLFPAWCRWSMRG